MTALTLTNFVAIGVGAALGAWSRWGLSLWLNSGPDRFPVGTFVANLGVHTSLDWLSHGRC